MFRAIRERLNWQSGKSRLAMAAAICAAGLAIGLGGSALLAQLNEGNPVPNTESTPNNIPCVDEGAFTPQTTLGACTLTSTYCDAGIWSGPIDAESCSGTAQGVNCTDTGVKACAIYEEGKCEPSDSGFFCIWDNHTTLASTNSVDTCTQSP